MRRRFLVIRSSNQKQRQKGHLNFQGFPSYINSPCMFLSPLLRDTNCTATVNSVVKNQSEYYFFLKSKHLKNCCFLGGVAFKQILFSNFHFG